MSQEQEKKSETSLKNDQAHKLDAIKEIIFGEQIQEYDSEFREIRDMIKLQKETMERDVREMKEELESLVRQVKEGLEVSLEKMKADTLLRLDNLEESKANRAIFAEILEDWAKKLRD